MRGPAFNRRIDDNHAKCREEYRRLGCIVEDIHGLGIADLFVIVPCGTDYPRPIGCSACHRIFVEVKRGPKEKLTDSEQKWLLLLGRQYVVVRSLDDVRASVENARKETNGTP